MNTQIIETKQFTFNEQLYTENHFSDGFIEVRDQNNMLKERYHKDNVRNLQQDVTRIVRQLYTDDFDKNDLLDMIEELISTHAVSTVDFDNMIKYTIEQRTRFA